MEWHLGLGRRYLRAKEDVHGIIESSWGSGQQLEALDHRQYNRFRHGKAFGFDNTLLRVWLWL